MTKILACTDGSAYAASIYAHAAWAALRMPAAVEVMHVLDQHRERAAAADMSGAISFDSRDDLMRQLTELEEAKGRLSLKQSRLILQDASAHLLADGVTDVKLTQRHGSLVECLSEAESRVDLVVIGKRGETAAAAMEHLGANIERVIRASHRPILVASHAYHPVERMVIAFDNGPSARKAVEYAAQKPLLKGLDCHLLTVGKIDEMEEGVAWARDQLERGGYTVHADIVAGEPDEVICPTVGQRKGTLLVMGAYGHSRVRQFIVGSTTATMVRTCHAPVLMFR
jgi:nucleotide-binding universal stress UspA family protein